MAGRSLSSNNWRARTETPSHTYNDTRSRTLGHNSTDCGGISHSPDIDHKRGEDDPQTLQAIDEGRRVYVGNLPYIAKTSHVESLFVSNEYQIAHINMSIDPYSGRNPSYCFVELTTKAQAEQAMQSLSGQHILGRPLKLGLGVSKNRKRFSSQTKFSKYPEQEKFHRWTRTDAEDHFEGYTEQGRRLWVGGLPKMGNHHSVNQGVRELFDGFETEAVSKVVIPATPAKGDPKAWNHRYLFVDFPSGEEALRAAKATDGRHAWGVKIRVKQSRIPGSHKPFERLKWGEEHVESDLP